MNTSHSVFFHVLAVVSLTVGLTACTVDGGVAPPTGRPLTWDELRPVIRQAVAATAVAAGEDWVQRPGLDPAGACAVAAGGGVGDSFGAAGLAVVWSGQVPAAVGRAAGRRILRDRFERPWHELGLVTMYEPPGPSFDGGRVVAKITGSPQLVLSGALAAGILRLDARAACYTTGLPGQ